MVFEMDLNAFLIDAGIEQEEWTRSGADWKKLCLIAKDFTEQIPALTSAAEQISSRIRTFPGVHSVRWRIKDATHLLKKIVRKKLEMPIQEKWGNISVENYLDVVTDLIGVRALHLFKDECVEIDSAICAVWDTCEPVVMYLRKGDEPIAVIIERGGVPKEHNAGYRSIHYIVRSQPEKKILKAEIQVRTIFQEGWSEIDHRVRYPDYSDNEHVKFFLDMFNGLAGSADEMGSFVKKLTKLLSEVEEQKTQAVDAVKGREQALAERDAAMIDIEERLNEFDQLKKQDAKSQEIIKKLKDDILRLRSSQHAANIWGGPIDDIIPSFVIDAGSAKKGKNTQGKWGSSKEPGDLASLIANANFLEIISKKKIE